MARAEGSRMDVGRGICRGPALGRDVGVAKGRFPGSGGPRKGGSCAGPWSWFHVTKGGALLPLPGSGQTPKSKEGEGRLLGTGPGLCRSRAGEEASVIGW